MFFAAPWVLVGLLAAAIPLLLHLVQRREAPEVLFPAVRYLRDATRDQQRRVTLRHWLLLLVRTLLIVALVLAAAGATLRRVAIGPHAPAALVLVVDNSAGSGAVIDGEPVLAGLVRAANGVLDRATAGDRLWLVAADGIPRSGNAAELRVHLAGIRPEPVWMDLGRAIGIGRGLIQSARRPGEVVVVSPVPRNAISAVAGSGDLLVLRPAGAPPANRALANLQAGLQPWSPAGGVVVVTLVSSDTSPVPVTITAGTRPLRDLLVAPGAAGILRINTLPQGWTILTATLPPDELRADDVATVAVRVAPPPSVNWDPADRFIDAAATVLANDGRIRAGSAVRLGALGAGASVIVPPADPAQVGALNRALAARGAGWRFGGLVVGAEATDTGLILRNRDPVTRRYLLEAAGEGGDVLATVGGTPWVVRSGDLILIGSRLDTAWTALPLSASFVPFLDAVLTSTAPGAQVDATAIVGVPLRLPVRTTAVVQRGVATPVDGTGRWTSEEAGVAFALAGVDTIGSIAVHLDPRISQLARASDADVRAAWPGSSVAGTVNGAAMAFAALGRGDLRGFFLLLALGCVIVELVLTGPVPRKTMPV